MLVFMISILHCSQKGIERKNKQKKNKKRKKRGNTDINI